MESKHVLSANTECISSRPQPHPQRPHPRNRPAEVASSAPYLIRIGGRTRARPCFLAFGRIRSGVRIPRPRSGETQRRE